MRKIPGSSKAPGDFCLILYQMLFVSEGIVGEAQKVIRGDMVEVRKADQNLRGDVPLTHLIVAVNALRTVEIFRQLPLFQVVIFPQVPDSLIYHAMLTSCIGYHSAFCSIGF